MNYLKLNNYKDLHSFNFGLGKPYLNDHFNIFSSNIKSKSFDYLVFVDSKGFNSVSPEKSWIINLINEFSKSKKSYLVITRVKELTTFFSLINFLTHNSINYKNLITNLGFVDLTPKKLVFIDDIILQNPFIKTPLQKKFLSKYIDESNKSINLYNIIIDNKLSDLISDFLSIRFDKIYLLETFEFDNSINVKRKRPNCFFQCLIKTNKLLSQLCVNNKNFDIIKFKVSDIKVNSSEISFDAVHFTDLGHEIVYNKVIKSLNLK